MCLCMNSTLEFGGYFCLWFSVGLVLFVAFFVVVLVLLLFSLLVWFGFVLSLSTLFAWSRGYLCVLGQARNMEKSFLPHLS